MATLDFPKTPAGTLAELWRAVLDLLPQLERGTIKDVAIATTETPVAHTLGRVPEAVFWSPHSNVTIWRSSPSTSRFVYLTASSACVADLRVT
jgi:hypothetical protein